MGFNVVQKLIAAIWSTATSPGQGRLHQVTQTLAHDLTAAGPSPLRAARIERIRCDLSVFYADHDVVPSTPAAVERLSYLRHAAPRFGAYFSRPATALPPRAPRAIRRAGRTLAGAAAHTQILGAVGMLALSAEAVEVAAAMAGEPFEIVVPRSCGSPSTARPALRVAQGRRPRADPPPGRRGLAGKAIEFDGLAARALGVYERATIASMGSHWRRDRGLPERREDPHLPAAAAPLEVVAPPRGGPGRRVSGRRGRRARRARAARPVGPEPGEVRPVRELQGRPVHEVLLGSCTNGSRATS